METNLPEKAVESVFDMQVDHTKLGVWTFLGSEAVFFSSLIVTYIVLRGRSVSGPTPRAVLDIPLTGVNTFVLVCSSLTMVLALSAANRGSLKSTRGWLGATMVLGLAFLAGQAFEFTHLIQQGLTLSTNLFGASFFTLTGFHGAHVFVGLIWIGFVFASLLRRTQDDQPSHRVELVGLYWHFVDLVWILIFTIVYLL